MFQFSGFFFDWDFSLGIFWFQCSSSKLFVVFYVPFLLHLKSSVEYLYLLNSFFLRSRGIEPLSWSWKDLILPLYYKRSSVLLSIGGNRTLFYDFADHITNPYNADVWVIVPALRTNYSGGNRTPATMLTASRSSIKLPNIRKVRDLNPRFFSERSFSRRVP